MSVNPVPVVAKVAAPVITKVAAPVAIAAPVASVGIAPIGIGHGKNSRQLESISLIFFNVF